MFLPGLWHLVGEIVGGILGHRAGQSRFVQQRLNLTAPSIAGTYYYGACVDAVTDESDITNNCSTSVQVTVSEPEPEPEPDPGAGPDCSLQIAGNEFIVCYIDGYKADAEITRDIVNEARAKFVVKYGRPARMSLQIKLYDEPTDSVRRGRTYYDGSAIHFLTPSSPSADSCCSQLGLRFNETDYHRSTITHEYFHAFHDALNVVASWRWGGWFREGIAHHEGVTAMTQDRWRSVAEMAEIVYRDRTISCGQSFDGAEQIVVTEVYWGGALLMRFLGDTFGEDVDRRLLLSSRMDVAHAITDELPAGRYGAGMIYLKLRQAGTRVNHKRVERLYTEARLQVRRRRRKKIPVADRQPLVRPQAPNEVWSADFVFDRTAEGRVVKCLTVVDDATTEAVAIVPARAFGGLPVTRVLDQLALKRGLPRILRTDNGKEFCGRAMLTWAQTPCGLFDEFRAWMAAEFGLSMPSAAPTMLTLSAASAPAEGGNPVTVTATLDNPAPANGTTVTLTTGGTATLDTDYTLSSTTITLAAGETAGTVTITVTDDAEDDDGETIVIDAESTSPALTADQLTLTIEDNDGPAPTMLTLSAASAPAEGGNPVTVIATLDNPAPANGMTVTLTTSGTATLDTDYTLSSTTFTLAEGETAGTVTITVTDDAEDDDGETIAIDAESTNPALTADQLTLTIEDNDVTPVPALPLGGAMLLGLLLTLLGAVRMRMRDRTDIARGC